MRVWLQSTMSQQATCKLGKRLRGTPTACWMILTVAFESSLSWRSESGRQGLKLVEKLERLGAEMSLVEKEVHTVMEAMTDEQVQELSKKLRPNRHAMALVLEMHFGGTVNCSRGN